MSWKASLSLLVGVAIGNFCADLHAGGGPENVFLVVNPNDADSRTIANHYCHLRRIPTSNVFEVDWKGSKIGTSIGTFRDSILNPIMKEIKRRKLTSQIDYIIYSSGFPYGIDYLSELGTQKPPAEIGRLGSLTGMTYLHEMVRTKDSSYAVPTFGKQVPTYISNFYTSYSPQKSRAFRSRYRWMQTGQRSKEKGHSYYLSTMLGYTTGPRGNTVDEVVRYLRNAATADGTQPRGTIYFMDNTDVRSATRRPGFAPAAAELQRLGINAEIIRSTVPKESKGILPTRRKDVMGLVAGYSVFDWKRHQSRILPGAICEHLTSFGGILKPGTGQTPLTEFLRHGAAGASGTVMEPYSLQVKFPHPTIHCRYAHGCSLAESFYQSVGSPYQLLIIGDPLCRPWAKIPSVQVDGIQDGSPVKGTVELRPSSDHPFGIRSFKLFVDGRLKSACGPGQSISWDTSKVADGYHDIRIVATEDTEIETQGRQIFSCRVNNHQRQIACEAFPPNKISMDDRFMIRVNAPEAKQVLVFHRRTLLAKLNQAQGEILIDPRKIGAGPAELTVVAKTGRGVANGWIAAPLAVAILPSQRADPLVLPDSLSTGSSR